MKLVFLDLETTDLEKDECKIIQYGSVIQNDSDVETFGELFSPGERKISLKSRAVHGITYGNLEGKKEFEKDKKTISKISNDIEDSIMVAHNGERFDFYILQRFGIESKFRIDTMKVAIEILEDYKEELEDSVSLQVIRYYFEDKLGIYVEKSGYAHEAIFDCYCLKFVFERLFEFYKEKTGKGDKEILKDFIDITKKEQHKKELFFGKYAKMNTKKMINEDVNYFEWCVKNLDLEKCNYILYWAEQLDLENENNEEHKKKLPILVEKFKENVNLEKEKEVENNDDNKMPL